jgi:hypothetical protein
MRDFFIIFITHYFIIKQEIFFNRIFFFFIILFIFIKFPLDLINNNRPFEYGEYISGLS